MALTNRDYLIMELLKCGEGDFGMIDGVGFDMCDILDELKDWADLEHLTLNQFLRAAYNLGIDCIQEAITARITELEAAREKDLYHFGIKKQRELEDLKRLKPNNDFDAYFNCIDSGAWFEHNEEIYRKYLPEAIDAFEEGTGFELGHQAFDY